MATKPTPVEELQAALDAYAAYGRRDLAAASVGIPATTLNSRLKAAEREGLKPSTSRRSNLEAEVKRLRKELAEAQKEADTSANIRERIYELAEYRPVAPDWLSEASKSSGKRGAPVTLWSDWHYGEVVKAAEVGGVNEFNARIAERRIKKLVDKTVELCTRHMGDAKLDYPGIVVCLGGDMISGDIHQELADTNDRTPHQAIDDLADIVYGALLKLADAFGNVFAPCVVGNHGRGTMKPRMKSRVYTSFEWNLYQMLERQFRGDSRVQFDIPHETDCYFTVYGHRFLLTHGDSLGVKGGDGIIGALGPIMRGAIKVARSEAQIGRDFDTILMGHWHQHLALPGVVVNNSLKGYDEFARLALRAPYSRPSQALFFVHPNHGVTAHWQVYLEPERSAKDAKKWVGVLR